MNKIYERAAEYANRHGGTLKRARRFLNRCGITDHGIEQVECVRRHLAYLNMGDTYATTICREGRGDVWAGSWGGWFEEVEQDHCEANDEIRCGYCGEFTPVEEDWTETVCEHCGRYVQDGARP